MVSKSIKFIYKILEGLFLLVSKIFALLVLFNTYFFKFNKEVENTSVITKELSWKFVIFFKVLFSSKIKNNLKEEKEAFIKKITEIINEATNQEVLQNKDKKDF